MLIKLNASEASKLLALILLGITYDYKWRNHILASTQSFLFLEFSVVAAR